MPIRLGRLAAPLLLATALSSLAGCAPGRAAWSPEAVTRLELRRSRERRVVAAGPELDGLLTCLALAPVEPGAALEKPSGTFDATSTRGAGRWLFDGASGRFTRLTVKQVPIYRLDDGCRLRVEQAFPPAPPAPDPSAEAPAAEGMAAPAEVPPQVAERPAEAPAEVAPPAAPPPPPPPPPPPVPRLAPWMVPIPAPDASEPAEPGAPPEGERQSGPDAVAAPAARPAPGP